MNSRSVASSGGSALACKAAAERLAARGASPAEAVRGCGRGLGRLLAGAVTFRSFDCRKCPGGADDRNNTPRSQGKPDSARPIQWRPSDQILPALSVLMATATAAPDIAPRRRFFRLSVKTGRPGGWSFPRSGRRPASCGRSRVCCCNCRMHGRTEVRRRSAHIACGAPRTPNRGNPRPAC